MSKPNLRTRAAQLRALKHIEAEEAFISSTHSEGTFAAVVLDLDETPHEELEPVAIFDLRRALTPKKKRKAK